MCLCICLDKVECGEYQVASYCASDKINRFAYGFRGGQEKIAFPLDTLFNSNAIVASALHLALINTVPILQTAGERRNLEKRCRGHCDLIFAYLRTLGTLGKFNVHAFMYRQPLLNEQVMFL
ncbi:Thioredoxin domain-containing protein 16 [Portunus trituberculatus]|uniref:Thioredoxin domain-containing protein 16 n=1 Tax=Portunus trituberculatus TaxID=210409 RepID=A0A5B7JI64_PORTR|nr:Thioredoxin domain-containing protein 16 [Portunus trituberculatus]